MHSSEYKLCEAGMCARCSGTSDAGVIWALASAYALTAVVRSCSRGHLTECTCGSSFAAEQRRLASTIDVTTQKTFMRKGCSFHEVLRFGLKGVRHYFNDRKASKKYMSLTQMVNSHNRRVGLRVSKNLYPENSSFTEEICATWITLLIARIHAGFVLCRTFIAEARDTATIGQCAVEKDLKGWGDLSVVYK